ncbi:MAG: hypothetical protein IPK75_12570 [Acidobacteria bacterium]|nr:hypothetical protein [Acidobacteriota bacterium]
MTVRPIIFSTPMVQALLAGRKTQTRRLASSPLRRVEVGDLLWVREAYRQRDGGVIRDAAGGFEDAFDPETVYAATSPKGGPFKPSIHMPRWASRLTLEVTRVRYDRLQAISREDCQAEGHPCRPEISDELTVHLDAAHDWFMDLWDTLHDKPGERWADDPQIVALTFKVHLANVDQVAAGKAVV